MSGQKKGRALALTAIMVISVIATGMAFTGGVAASDVDRNDVPGDSVSQGADEVKVFDFSISSEDEILDGDGDVNPGDDLTALNDSFSYVDDNGNQQYERDEVLILDNDTSDDDMYNTSNGDTLVRTPDGAFVPYEFNEDKYFVDVNNDTDDRGTYDGENFSDEDNTSKEAILQSDDGNITADTDVLVAGQANVTQFSSGQIPGTPQLYLFDDENTGDSFDPGEGDFLFISSDGSSDYDASQDTIVSGDNPGGDVSAKISQVSATDLADQLIFLDFSQDGNFDFNTTNVTGPDPGNDSVVNGSEPIALTGEETNTGDPLPLSATFLEPSDDLGNNYYEQYDEEGDDDDSDTTNFEDDFEEGGDSGDGDDEQTDVGLQNMSSTDTLFLDEGGTTFGVNEDVVENDIEDGNLLVDGIQTNANDEDIGPDADGDDTPSEDLDDAVIRGQDEFQGEIPLFTKDDDDDNLELVFINEEEDGINEGSGAFPADATYGDAVVDLTIANTGTATHKEDYSGATLYRESDGTEGFSDGDTFVKSTTFEGNNALGIANGQFEFTSLNQTYGNESARFYVTTDVQNNADTGDTLQFAIPQYRDGGTNYAFDQASAFFSGASDTGLFLESEEDASTGPVTDADGDIENENDYYEGAGVSPPSGGNTGSGPIVADDERTIVASGGGGGGGEDVKTLTIIGSGERADYTFSVTDNLEKSTANDANINDNDEVRRGYAASGQTGISADSYTYTGELETFGLDGDATVLVDGENMNEEVADKRDNVIEIDGNDGRTNYDFAATDGNSRLEKTTSNNANINANDEIFRTTGNGQAGISKDAYGFNGVIDSLDVNGGDADVYVNGKEVDPANEQDNMITIVGTGERVNYEFTVDEGGLAPSNANYANTNGNDEISGMTKTGVVGISADSNDYNGDITDFSADGDVQVYIDGQQIDQDDVASEA